MKVRGILQKQDAPVQEIEYVFYYNLRQNNLREALQICIKTAEDYKKLGNEVGTAFYKRSYLLLFSWLSTTEILTKE